MCFFLFFIDIIEIQIALVLEKMRICEGNFVYSKILKPPELISFLFGGRSPIVKKLSVFAIHVTKEFNILGKQTLGF